MIVTDKPHDFSRGEIVGTELLITALMVLIAWCVLI